MPKLPHLSGKELIKAYTRDAWIKVSQKGSHVKLVKYREPVGKSTIIIPLHKTLKKGTLSGILRDSGMPLQKLEELL